MLSLLLSLALLQLPDTTCVRVTAVIGTRARADTVAHVRCLPPRVDTVRVVRVDTLRLLRVDTLWRDRPGPDSLPRDSVPRDSVPSDSVPPDSLPSDTLPTPTPSGVAELPRAVPTWPSGLATAPCTSTFPAAQLQGAVNLARAGEVLCLAPGDRFRGTLTLPARGDSGWVVVRTAPTPGQPAPGERVRPSQGATLATIEATGTNPAIVTAPSARGWLLQLLEVRTDSTFGTLTYALIDLQTPPTRDAFARDIVLDRIWAHGWAHRPLRRCVSLQSGATAIVNSWLDDCHEKGSDSQAIASWSGTGPYLIENNTLAGAGENILFGGGDPRFPGVHPSDVTVRRNWLVTPPSWRGVWTKKNLLETKNVARLLVEANVLEGSWSDGQDGYAIVIKSANQSGSARHRDSGTRDLTIRRNLIQHAGAALTLSGRGGDAGNIDSVTRRVVIQENFADSLGTVTLDTRGVMLLTGAQDVAFLRNTWLAPPTVNSYTGGSKTSVTLRNARIDGDLLTRGRYGRMGCWTASCTPGVSFTAALLGTGAPLAPFQQFPSLAEALAAGFGVSRATIDAATRGVVQQP